MFLVFKDYFIGQNKNLYYLVKILLKLAEVNFYLLRTASVRDSNFCHTPYSFFVFIFTIAPRPAPLWAPQSRLVRSFLLPLALHSAREDY